jgi:hypothetical protein
MSYEWYDHSFYAISGRCALFLVQCRRKVRLCDQKRSKQEIFFSVVEQSTRTGKNDTQAKAKPSTRTGKVQIKVACQLSSVVAN